MPVFMEKDLLTSDKAWRINFVNSLVGAKNLHLLITRSSEGIVNAAIFNSGLHIGSSPPYVGFLLRPKRLPRHTYQNLLHYPYATLNAIPKSLYPQAHLTHHHIPPDESEIDYAGLETEGNTVVGLPFLKGSPLRVLLRFCEEHLLSVNQTRLLIFAILWVEIQGPVAEDGFIRLDELDLVAGSGCDAYYELRFLGREAMRREGP